MLYSFLDFRLKLKSFLILEGVSRLVLIHASTSFFLDFLFLGHFLYQFDRPGVKVNPGKLPLIFLKGNLKLEITIYFLIHNTKAYVVICNGILSDSCLKTPNVSI